MNTSKVFNETPKNTSCKNKSAMMLRLKTFLLCVFLGSFSIAFGETIPEYSIVNPSNPDWHTSFGVRTFYSPQYANKNDGMIDLLVMGDMRWPFSRSLSFGFGMGYRSTVFETKTSRINYGGPAFDVEFRYYVK